MAFGQIIQGYVHPWDIIWHRSKLTAAQPGMWNQNELLDLLTEGERRGWRLCLQPKKCMCIRKHH